MRDGLKYFGACVVAVGVMAGATLLAWTDDWNADWQMRPALSVDRVHFIIQHSSALGHWRSGNDVSLDNFRGFSLAMLAGGGPAKFEYVGDAGRLLCEGHFALGSGSGSFKFSPNADFAQELSRMGYDAPDEERLFSMLVQGVDRQFAREVHDANLHASARQLIDLRTHGVGGEYLREVRRSGYTDFDADDYIQLRIHGVSSDFLRDVHADGYNMSAHDIVQLRIHGVSSDYLRGLKNAGYGALRADEIAQLRIHGVQTRLIEESRRAGYNFTPEELTDLQVHGVTGDYLRKIKKSGMRDLTAEQIAKLRVHGVE